MWKKIKFTFAAAVADFFIGFHNHLSVNKYVITQIKSIQTKNQMTKKKKYRQSIGCICVLKVRIQLIDYSIIRDTL